MDQALLLHFIVICFIIEATPGPNMGYLAILTMRDGYRAGLATVAGIAAGLALIGTIAALGIASVLTEGSPLYLVLRWLCVAYLLWIAWQSWSDDAEISPARAQGFAHNVRHFRRGVVINVLSPKAAIFYVSILPGFITPSLPVLKQTLLLTALSVTIATAMHLAIVWLASRLAPTAANAGRRKMFRKTMALLLAAVALWFAL